MQTVGHQIDVVQRFIFRRIGHVAHFDAAQIFDPRHALYTGHDQAQRITIFRAQHFAIHAVRDHHIIERVFDVDRASHAAAICTFGKDVLRFF